jgi:protein-S-isoprenylcysteine O-methyltransferase Ste14
MNTHNKVHTKGTLFHIAGVISVVQFVLIFFFHNPGFAIAYYTGWAIWVVSIVLGWIPVMHLRKKGEVPEGESYVKTQKLVDTGVYSLVRHPQYTGLFLFNVALIFISQHWVIAVIGVVSMVLTYISMIQEEQGLLQKFGDEYQEYMERVPRMNVVLGAIRALKQ